MDIAQLQNALPEDVDANPNLSYINQLCLQNDIVDRLGVQQIVEEDFGLQKLLSQQQQINFTDDGFVKINQAIYKRIIQEAYKSVYFLKNCNNNFFQKVEKYREILLKNLLHKLEKDNSTFSFISDIFYSDKNQKDFENLSGNKPRTWPTNLDNFLFNISEMSIVQFFYQKINHTNNFYNEIYAQYDNYRTSISNQSITDDQLQNLIKILQAHLCISFMKGSQNKIQDFISTFTTLLKNANNEIKIKLASEITITFSLMILKTFKFIKRQQPFFKPLPNNQINSFQINNINYTDFNPNEQYACTTDGKFLYEMVANKTNIFLSKIGTGKQQTGPGLIYHQKIIQEANQRLFSLAVIKDNLYIRFVNQGMMVNVYDKETLEFKHYIHLNISDYLRNQYTKQYNVYFQLISDGQFLYTVLIDLSTKQLTKIKNDNKSSDKTVNINNQQQNIESKPTQARMSSKQIQKSKQSNDYESGLDDNGSQNQIKITVYKQNEPAKQQFINIQNPNQFKEEMLIKDDIQQNPLTLQNDQTKKTGKYILNNKARDDLIRTSVQKQTDGGIYNDIALLRKHIFTRMLDAKQKYSQPTKTPVTMKNSGMYYCNMDLLMQQSEASEETSDINDMHQFIPKTIIQKTMSSINDKTQNKRQTPPVIKMQNKTDTQTKTNNNLTFYIDFFVLKFNVLDENRQLEINNLQKNIQDNKLLQELYDTYQGFFSVIECQEALVYAHDNVPLAAEYLFKRQTDQNVPKVFSPFEQILIYQTETNSQNYNQDKVEGHILAKNKSILVTSDIYQGQWMVYEKTIYKSNGCLFSLNFNDTIFIDQDDFTNKCFIYNSNDQQIQDLITMIEKKDNNIFNTKIISELLKDAPLQPNEIKRTLFLKRTKKEQIQTTFLKKYDIQQSKTLTSKKQFFDNYSKQFYEIEFNRFDKAQLIMQNVKITFINSLCQDKIQQQELSTIKEINKFISFEDISSWQNSALLLICNFNMISDFMPTRINLWPIHLLNQFINQFSYLNDKQKQNFINRIKKLSKQISHLQNVKIYNKKFLGIRNPKIVIDQLLDIIIQNKNDQTIDDKLIEVIKNICIKSQQQNIEDNYFTLIEKIKQNIPNKKIIFNILNYLLFLLKNDNQQFNSLLEYLINQSFDNQYSDYFISSFRKLLQTDKYGLQKINNSKIIKNNIQQIIEDKLSPNNKKLDYKTISEKDFFPIIETDTQENKQNIILPIVNFFFSDNIINEAFFVLIKNITNNQSNLKEKINFIFNLIQVIYSKIIQSNSHNKNSNQYLKLVYELIKIIKYGIQNGEENSYIFNEILKCYGLLNHILQNTTFSQNEQLCNIIDELMYIITKIQQINAPLQPTQQPFSFSGPNISQLQIIETPHPIERNMNITFKKIHFQQAIGFILEFDKRCQDEENSDHLIINSSFDNQKQMQNGVFDSSIINKSVNISGKKNFKRFLFMLGNTIDFQFTSSGVAKNNLKSLHQWGYLIYLRPIIGFQYSHTPFQYQLSLNMRFLYSQNQSLYIFSKLISFLMRNIKLNNTKYKTENNILGFHFLNNGVIDNSEIQNNENIKNINNSIVQYSEQAHQLSESDNQSIISHTINNQLIDLNRNNLQNELHDLNHEQNKQLKNLQSQIKSMQQLPYIYIQEQMKQSFTIDIQTQWDDIINQVIFICLKIYKCDWKLLHNSFSNPISVHNYPSFEQQLIKISKIKNCVLSFMVKISNARQLFNQCLFDTFQIYKEKYLSLSSELDQNALVTYTPQKEICQKQINHKDKVKSKIKEKIKFTQKKKKEIKQNKPKEILKKELDISQINQILNDKQVNQKIKEQLELFLSNKQKQLELIFNTLKIEITKDFKTNINILSEVIQQEIKSQLKINNNIFSEQITLDSPYTLAQNIIKERLQLLGLLNYQIEEQYTEDLNQSLTLSQHKSTKSNYFATSDIFEQEFFEEELKPLGKYRTMTSEAKFSNTQKSNSKKIKNVKKQFLQSIYTRKQNKNDNNEQLFNNIISFFSCEELINIKYIYSVLLQKQQMLKQRINGLQKINQLQKQLPNQQSFFPQTEIIIPSLYSSLNIIDSIIQTSVYHKKLLQSQANDVLFRNILSYSSNINIIENYTVGDFSIFKNIISKCEYIHYQEYVNNMCGFMQNLYIRLLNILCVLQGKKLNIDQQTKKQLFFFQDIQEEQIFKQWLESLLQTQLLLQCTNYISIEFKSFQFITQRLLHINNLILNDMLEYYYDQKYLSHIIFKFLLKQFNEEDVKNKNSQSFDIIAEEKIIFLINILQRKLNNFTKEEKQKLFSLLLHLMLHTKNFLIIQKCSNLLNSDEFSEQCTTLLINKQLLNNQKSESLSPLQENTISDIIRKIGQLLDTDQQIDNPDVKEQIFVVFLHLNKEEEFNWLIKLMYDYEQNDKNYKQKLIQNYSLLEQQLLQNDKEKPNQHIKEVTRVIAKENENEHGCIFEQKYRLYENIFNNIPSDCNNNQLQEYIHMPDYSYLSKNKKQCQTLTITKVQRKQWELKNLNRYIQVFQECLSNFKLPIFKTKKDEEDDKKKQQENDELEKQNQEKQKKEDKEKIAQEEQQQQSTSAELLLQNEDDSLSKHLMILEQINDELGNFHNSTGAESLHQLTMLHKINLLESIRQINDNTSISQSNKKQILDLFKKKTEQQINKLKNYSQQKENSNKQKQIIYYGLTKEEEDVIKQKTLDTYNFLSIMLQITQNVKTISNILNKIGFSAFISIDGLFQQNLSAALQFKNLFEYHKTQSQAPIQTDFIINEFIQSKIKTIISTINQQTSNSSIELSIANIDIFKRLNDNMQMIFKMKAPKNEITQYSNKYSFFIDKQPRLEGKIKIANQYIQFIQSQILKHDNIKQYFKEEVSHLLKNYNKQSDNKKCTFQGLLMVLFGDSILTQHLQEQQQYSYFFGPLETGQKLFHYIDKSNHENVIQQVNIVQQQSHNIFSNKIASIIDIHDLENYIIQQISDINELLIKDFDQQIQKSQLLHYIAFQLLFQTYTQIFYDQQKKPNKAILDFILNLVQNNKIKSNQINRNIYEIIIQRLLIHDEQTQILFSNTTLNNQKEVISKIQKQNQKYFDFDNKNLIAQNSTYYSEMEMFNKQQNDLKMLRYWERNIIPKIYNFVKDSLSKLEIEDFFEQMRIELRKNNHAGANNIAYILCDQKLPTDCFIPGLQFDWSSLDIEATHIGQYVSIKLGDSKGPFSQIVGPTLKKGQKYAYGQVLFRDPVNQQVNVLVNDYLSSNAYAIWVPQQSIKSIKNSHFVPQIKSEQMQKVAINYIKQNIKNQFIQVLKQGEIQKQISLHIESNYTVIDTILVNELGNDCLNGWQKKNFNSIVLLRIIEGGDIQKYITHIIELSEKLKKYFQQNSLQLDLVNENIKQQKQDNDKLNIIQFNGECQQTIIKGIILEFNSKSKLYKCSGINFYDDEFETNNLETIQASQKSNIEKIKPIIFNSDKVYYEYFYNAEALPIYQKSNNNSSLLCNISFISGDWNLLLWLLEQFSLFFIKQNNFDNYKILFNVIVDMLMQFQGPNLCRQCLFKLLSNQLFILYDILSSQEQLIHHPEIIDIINQNKLSLPLILDEFKNYYISQKDDFPSRLTQNIAEFIIIYSSLEQQINPSFQLPGIFEELQLLFQLTEFLQPTQEKKQMQRKYVLIKKLIQNKLNAEKQFKQLLIIQNIPSLLFQQIKNVIDEAIIKHKVKILKPDIDIYIPTDTEGYSVGYAMILFDGFQFQDPPIFQKQQNDQKNIEEAPKPKIWVCEICTLNNDDCNDICAACEMPKPLEPNYIKEDEEVCEEDTQNLDIINIETDQLNDTQILTDLFRQAILENFERITPDKRIIIKQVFDNNNTQPEEYTEILEFFLCRQTNEDFSIQLENVIQRSKDSITPYIKSEQIQNIFELDPVEQMQFLAKFGYDLWLEQSCASQMDNFEIKPLLSSDELALLSKMVEDDLMSNQKLSSEINCLHFRIEFKNALKNLSVNDNNLFSQLKYDESKNFYLKLMKLNKYTNLELREALVIIFEFNRLIQKYYKLINMAEEEGVKEEENNITIMAHKISKIKQLWLQQTKRNITQELMTNTAMLRDNVPKITIERLTKEREIINQKRTFTNNSAFPKYEKQSELIQLLKQISQIDTLLLRPTKPKGSESFICFEVIFKDEHVMGEAGPYRQLFSDISREIQNQASDDSNLPPFFILTPNSLANENIHKYFLPNSSFNGQQNLAHFECIGIIMGCSMRTGTFLPLELPKLFWKRILNEKISETDIEEIDTGAFQLLKYFKQCQNDSDLEDMEQKFDVTLIDGNVQELLPNGSKIYVNAKNRNKFVQLFFEAKCHEFDKQINSIKSGISKIVPNIIFSYLDHVELQKMICGNNEVDFELLQKNTSYSGGWEDTSPLIKELWIFLKDMKAEDKIKFVKFCWGSERLPLSQQDYDFTSTRFMIKKAQYKGCQDGLLPRADTCFFNFELPNYSFKDIMIEKILLAINTDCDSMNAEEVISENQNVNQSWASFEEEEEEEFED